MKRQILITLLLPLAGAVTSASASWQLVEDFEGGMDNIYSLRFPEPEPIIGIFEDPVDETNNMFYLSSNAYGVVDWAPNYVAIPLPAALPAGGEGTLYFRFHNLGSGHDMSGGLSPVQIVPDPETPYENGMSQPGGWAALEAQFQMHAPGSDLFRVRHGAAFEATQIAIPNNEWVEIWMHVNHAANTTEFYVKTAADAAPVKAVFTDEFGAETTAADFRNGTTEPLVTFFMGTVAGLADNPVDGDAFFIDDIYIDVTGLNLSSPSDADPGMSWAGYPMQADGLVDTGDWMGMIHVMGDFVYSHELASWIFLPEEHVEEGSAWSYFIR